RVIFLTSMSAKQPIPGLILSNTARAGMLGFAKTLASEVAADGVLVNTVLPGHFDTDRAAELARMRAEREGRSVDELLRNRAAGIPLGPQRRPARDGGGGGVPGLGARQLRHRHRHPGGRRPGRRAVLIGKGHPGATQGE
ncbi:MAG TPA: SDR family NAD(P)-dependent oxidoreductase, partial [Longimicrobium sp.]